MLPGGTYRIIVFSLLLVLRSALAQGPSEGILDGVVGLTEVVVAGDAQIEADPGIALTVGFEVRNRQNQPVTFTSYVDVPDGWSVIAPNDAFEIPGNGHALRLVGLRIPDEYVPGSYRVIFTAVTADRQFEDQAELVIDVGTFHDLRIYVLNAPRLVSASKPHAIEFVIHNMGNTGVTAHLEVESTPFPAILGEEVITITANGHYPVSVYVEPDPNLTRQSRSRVRLRGRLVEDATVIAEAQALVDVVPDGARAHSLRPRVEFNARVSSAGDHHGQGLQTEIVCRVPLSGDNAHQAEFTLRTPSTTRTVLSQADTYALSYSGPRFWGKLGDHVFDVSPLTSVGRFGTGVGVGAKFGRISARAH